MGGEQQLERSVLEAKERDELQAIADALSLKPSSRAKKSDLVDQILRATGVEPDNGAAEEKPNRTRARKAPASAEPASPPDGEPAAGGNGTAPTLPLDEPGQTD